MHSTGGFRNILVHGHTVAPDAEVFLRLNGTKYQIGSEDGTTHKASLKIPAGDVGTWVHLAGTYDGTAWRLYRNGGEKDDHRKHWSRQSE